MHVFCSVLNNTYEWKCFHSQPTPEVATFALTHTLSAQFTCGSLSYSTKLFKYTRTVRVSFLQVCVNLSDETSLMSQVVSRNLEFPEKRMMHVHLIKVTIST